MIVVTDLPVHCMHNELHLVVNCVHLASHVLSLSPCPPAPLVAATKMFVMVQAPASCAPQSGFLPKRGFAISLRKAFQVLCRLWF